MVEDEPDGDVQNAGGGVVDKPEGFEVEGVDSVAPGRRACGRRTRSRGGRWRCGAVAAASRRFSAPSLDRIRVRTVGIVTATNLVTCTAIPTSSIYGTARRGPTNRLLGWASLIRTRVKGLVAVGPTGGDQY